MFEYNYLLMHKDCVCGEMALNVDTGALLSFRLTDSKAAPFLGNADARRMARWLAARAVPASRESMRRLLERAGITSTEYLVKNLALSLSDTYWICPRNTGLSWSDVNLYDANAGRNGILPYHNESSYDPNASLGGQMEKYWDISRNPPVLVKTAYRQFGQQAVNEAFAVYVHERQNTPFPFVRYRLRKTADNGLQSLCPAFTSAKAELVPAMEIVDSRKPSNDISLYDHYIEICARHGLDREYIRDFMDYQTLTDFVISNMDEHFMNFGVLRDADTLTFLAPAPIYDSGNSMFFEVPVRAGGLTRQELLQQKLTGLHDTEEKMLRHVKNKKVLKESLLPAPSEVLDFYAGQGIPEDKANFIAKSYEQKLSLLRDFLAGKEVSLYHEKRRMAGMT